MFAYMPPPPPPIAIEHVIIIDNPLLTGADHLPYERIQVSHFIPAYQKVFDDIKVAMNQLTFSETTSVHEFITCIESIEHSKERIEQAFSLFHETMDRFDLRAISEEFDSLCINCNNFLYHHPTMIAFLNHFKSESIFPTLSPLEKRIIDQLYNDLLLQGAFLPSEDQTVFIETQKQLLSLTRTFNNNINDSMKTSLVTVYDKDQLRGLTSVDIETAFYNYHNYKGSYEALEEGPWAFSLDNQTARNVMLHGESRELRRSIILKKNELAALPPYSNKEIIKSILTLKQKLAHLLGFDNYTAMSLHTKMAQDSASIIALFSEIEAKAKIAHDNERVQLQEFATDLNFEGELEDWDLLFYSNKLEQSLFSIDFEALKDYFSLDHTLTTLFDFSSQLFDIHIEQQPQSTWHSDVLFYQVSDNQGSPIASFYIDPFSRIGTKRLGAWMDVIDYRWNDQGTQHLPITYIATNFTKPDEGRTCLLSLREVETLFHEFGHTLQHLLSKQNYKTISGLRGIEWDGVEIASQFMENWVYYKPLLKKLASHHKTGSTLTDEMIDNILKAKQFGNGSRILSQIALSKLDLILHGDYIAQESKKTPGEIYIDLLEAAGFKPNSYERSLPCRFGHIFGGGYSAGFYSYLYAQIRSADLFAAFEETDFNKNDVSLLGTRYKETFLQLGASLDPDEVFKLFRSRAPNTDAIIRHLGLQKKEPIN